VNHGVDHCFSYRKWRQSPSVGSPHRTNFRCPRVVLADKFYCLFHSRRQVGADFHGVDDLTPIISLESTRLYPSVWKVTLPLFAKEQNAPDCRHPAALVSRD
jgi:hypothetical protein